MSRLHALAFGLRRSGFAVLALGAAACSRARPTVAPAPFPATFAFVAASPADSAFQVTLEGTATFDRGWLTVNVPHTTITVPPGNPQNWRNLTVRAFVATDFRPGDWKAVAQSRPVNVFRFLNFVGSWTVPRTLSLETPLSFFIPVPPGATAATSRLAFEMEWVVVMGDYGDTDSRIAFSGPIPAPPFP